jgi:hypothetical protein
MLIRPLIPGRFGRQDGHGRGTIEKCWLPGQICVDFRLLRAL